MKAILGKTGRAFIYFCPSYITKADYFYCFYYFIPAFAGRANTNEDQSRFY